MSDVSPVCAPKPTSAGCSEAADAVVFPRMQSPADPWTFGSSELAVLPNGVIIFIVRQRSYGLIGRACL